MALRRVTLSTWFAVWLVSLVPAVAVAQAPGNASPAQQAAPKPPEKQPPPPLFPRHRRGLYKNAQGIEVIDATPQSPPLAIDDPGTPDPGEFEINFTANSDYAISEQRFDLVSVDANYGVLPVIAGHQLPTQIKIEFPVAAAREAGEPFSVGLGTASFGVKFNFYRDERRGVVAAWYPQIEFAPSGREVDKGLAEAGETLILPLLIEKEFHTFTFVANGAIEHAFHDPGRATAAQFSGGIGRAVTRKVGAMIEVHDESSLDLRNLHLLFINAGVIHGVRNIITYANIGHSLRADDDHGHTYAGFGVKLLLDRH